MTPPGAAAGRFAAAAGLGLALGITYSFLRPLSRRWLGDLVFSAALLWAWMYLAFGIWALTNLPAPKLRKVS